jgi:phosphatidylglycerophosphatase A
MKPTDRAAFALGTWFGCGMARGAPGTVGSLGAVPLHFLLLRVGLGPHLAVIVAITAIGTWAAHRVAAVLNEEDPQRVVIDEVAGVLIAMAFVRGTSGLVPTAAAFVLFRFFDITKPGPIARAEHAKPVGFGIMADDLLAGLAAGVVARLGVALAASF